MPDNLSEVSGLVAAEPDGLRLKDGNIISPAPDAIVLATGYHFTLARFLSPSCGIRTANGQVFPLFKNLINPHHPSMFLMGLLNDVAQFPMYHVQALAARAALEGRWRLPGSQEMLRQASEEVERAVRRYGKPRHTHLMRDEQWSYNAELLENAGFKGSDLPPFLKEVYYACWTLKRKYLVTFREISVLINREDGRVVLVPDNDNVRVTQEDLEAIRSLVEGRSPHPATVATACNDMSQTKKRRNSSKQNESTSTGSPRQRYSSCSSTSDRPRLLNRVDSFRYYF